MSVFRVVPITFKRNISAVNKKMEQRGTTVLSCGSGAKIVLARPDHPRTVAYTLCGWGLGVRVLASKDDDHTVEPVR